MSSRRIVAAIIVKDLRLFARDRFYAFISVLTLVMFGGLFWLLPATVDTTITIGVVLPGNDLFADGTLADEGDPTTDPDALQVIRYQSAVEARAAVANNTVMAAIIFDPDVARRLTTGEQISAQVVLSGEAPPELGVALAGAARELVHTLLGDPPPVTFDDSAGMIVGTGGPLAMREQLRPLLIFVVLMMEMFALASLVAIELAQRTASAVMVTPASSGQLLAAKTILGAMLAFGQAMLIAAVTGSLARQTTLVVTVLLLGAVLVTGFGLLAGATGKDFITIVFWSVLFFVPLAIPAFAVLFPGTPATWIRLLPSYGLIDTLLEIGRGGGWRHAWDSVVILAGWCAAICGAGLFVLKHRIERA